MKQKLKRREYACPERRRRVEYLAGKTLLWFGYFVCLGFLILLAMHG